MVFEINNQVEQHCVSTLKNDRMKTLQTIIVSFLAGLAGAYAFFTYQEENKSHIGNTEQYQVTNYQPSETFKPNISSPSTAGPMENVDFSKAAEKTIPSVVYINSISQSGVSFSFWDQMFNGSGQQTQVSSGSGVIFSADGYIVTNNHVVETAEKIQVIYNKRAYEAELIGTDASTDLAVLKIKESNLPVITLGSSKALAVGEWVVAVGNPFSLSSTVTVGIVSAKGRRINIVEDKFPIESFIQTDAAINPGNSGGALVNKNGELIGINTAILSRTGSYTGYAFAVPIDIAKKVVDDLIKHGVSQKPIFGGNVIEYDYQNAAKYGIDINSPLPNGQGKDLKGVLVGDVDRAGAAYAAGLREGDIITKLNNVDINYESAFEEELSYRSPGDKITITYLRDNKIGTATVTLVNKNGDTKIIKRVIYNNAVIGANLEAVDYGVKVTKIKDGLFKNLGLPENFTIIQINRQRVKDPQAVIDFFNSYKGKAVMYGVNSSKQQIPYSFYLQ